MQEMYNKSLQMMKLLEEKPSRAEWNKIAKENCLMSYLTLQCWEKKSFSSIWESVKEAE